MLSEKTKERINQYLICETDFLRCKETLTFEDLRDLVGNSIETYCQSQKISISAEERDSLRRELLGPVTNCGPLQPLLDDRSVTEIMVNGYDRVFVERDGRMSRTDIRFDDESHCLQTIQRMLAVSAPNRRVDEASPHVDFILRDGSRVNVVLPPCARNGPVITIRKFRDDVNTVEDLLALEMLDSDTATLLVAAMQARLNVVFCGATGAGKTTALNAFSRHIPPRERIVTIENTPELRLHQEHVVSLVSRSPNIAGKGEVTIRELFLNSLRMRPDRIILGEVRGEEILDMIQAIASGHCGSLSILHANSAEDCFDRMVTMMLMTGIQLATEEVCRQVARAIDLIVHVELYPDGRRRISTVTDTVWDPAARRGVFKHLFQFEGAARPDGAIDGHWVRDRSRPSFYEKLAKRFVALPEGFFVS
ncbi:MAG: ATPase, T2SS/T4P/T4SS family [Planctomycetota bacterium]